MEVKSDLNSWHALFVVTGQEENVKERLLYRFEDSLKVLVPKRKIRERKDGAWSYKIKTLFPGYVLVNGDIGVNEFHVFRETPGLIKLLHSEFEPLKIQPCEMNAINALTCDGEIIGISEVFIRDRRIVVVDGPLLSMEGQIISVDKRKGRAKVMVDFLGEARTIELGINIIKPLEN